jgi:translocation and assembly module TamB
VTPDAPLVFEATTVPNAAFWQELAAITGIELRDPEAEAHVTGTWMRPIGEVRVRAARLAVDPTRIKRPIPSVEALDVALTGEPTGLKLDHLSLTIEGQAVRASGRLPVASHGWSEVLKDPVAFARGSAQARIEVQEASVAAFSRFLPAALAPVGRLQADIGYDRGVLSGFVRLRNAATRPLGPLGVLQDVTADVQLANRTVEFQHVTAQAGGQPVTLTGIVRLGANGTPYYDLALRGQNLPFVRQTGLLVRGDLDLKLQTPAQGPPQISGNVQLRDSLFLADFRAYLPRGGASAAHRPPYFSIETAPLNTWTLAVNVSGERFMRVRMPVFAGLASAHFRLSGTLGEPRALGDATVDEGRVLMPFASFDVNQGAVRLTEENPYEPTIFLRGKGRRYGYDLTLEVSGGASKPNITFTSSPALESDQLLLMVMTGAAPSNEMNNTATQRVAQIGRYLGQSLIGSLSGNSAEADRLSIASGEKISRQGKETYDIEYRLSDRWMLTSEYDEFDDYNIGLKWRVAPRRGEKETQRDGRR